MTSKPSNREVKQALFDERQMLKGAAEMLDDRNEVDDLRSVSAPRRVRPWVQRYDVLGR